MNCWSVDSVSRARVLFVVFRYCSTTPKSAADDDPEDGDGHHHLDEGEAVVAARAVKAPVGQLHGSSAAVVAPLHG